MKFDWSNFSEDIFNEYKGNKDNELYIDNYFGCARVGDLCFDFVAREFTEGILTLTYDLYVGGVDTGYGYGIDNYPYDYADGNSFKDITNMSYKEFVSYAEKVMTEYITNHENKYEYASLTEKANEDLKIW